MPVACGFELRALKELDIAEIGLGEAGSIDHALEKIFVRTQFAARAMDLCDRPSPCPRFIEATIIAYGFGRVLGAEAAPSAR